MNEKIEKADANEVVSPKNTEKLYGKKADQPEPKAAGGETTNQALPEDFDSADQEVGHNMFPSHSARDPQDLGDMG
jgi:hypothetical protein